jgi:hypothetical protein
MPERGAADRARLARQMPRAEGKETGQIVVTVRTLAHGRYDRSPRFR